MDSAIQELFDLFSSHGWDGRIVRIERLDDLREAIHSQHDRGTFGPEFYQEFLADFSFESPGSLPDAQSIIIIAVPVPQARVIFRQNGKSIPVIVPPTYVGYKQTTLKAQKVVEHFLAPKGFKVAITSLPLKTLAVRSGLADYGKNNLCYVPGMGSFLQLVGCYTDLPCPEDSWRQVAFLESCKTCDACQQKCPTGAIGKERFLLDAERCLTFHNERTNDIPEWIDASAHKCLIGCMYCQSICPQNKPKRRWIENKCEFSSAETSLILTGEPQAKLPIAMVEKFESLELTENYEILARNVRLLF